MRGGIGLRALAQLWRDLGAEIDAEFGSSLKTRIEDLLLGVLATASVLLSAVALIIQLGGGT